MTPDIVAHRARLLRALSANEEEYARVCRQFSSWDRMIETEEERIDALQREVDRRSPPEEALPGLLDFGGRPESLAVQMDRRRLKLLRRCRNWFCEQRAKARRNLKLLAEQRADLSRQLADIDDEIRAFEKDPTTYELVAFASSIALAAWYALAEAGDRVAEQKGLSCASRHARMQKFSPTAMGVWLPDNFGQDRHEMWLLTTSHCIRNY